MDIGSGHIGQIDKIEFENKRGDLVPWKVGETVIAKGCKFMVTGVSPFPADKVILKGMPWDEKLKEE